MGEEEVVEPQVEGVFPEHERAQTESEIMVLRTHLRQARIDLANSKIGYLVEKGVPGIVQRPDGRNHLEQIKDDIAKQETLVEVLSENLNHLLDEREENPTIHISPIEIPSVVG